MVGPAHQELGHAAVDHRPVEVAGNEEPLLKGATMLLTGHARAQVVGDERGEGTHADRVAVAQGIADDLEQ
eukprot:2330398-Alexandrium_andersonii.AAC.1